MSCVVKVAFKISAESQAAIVGIGLACIAQGLKELNYAYEKNKEVENCEDQLVAVDFLIKTLDGQQIGVIQKETELEFIAKDTENPKFLDAVKKVQQKYSKNLLLHELNNKGYQKVKEEKLPNGSIRMVVERWD